MRFFLVLLLTGQTLISFAQDHTHAGNRKLKFPDVPGFKTLKCDFHQHTVFSDGSVWPDIRVMEALYDGLDAISLTEHLEYQPHKEDIPHPDRNRSYNLAVEEAKNHNLIIVRGSEITRKMPPGHCNAIFINDANQLLIKDSVQIFRAAKQQGAFVFWNHPNWMAQRSDGMATLTDMHRLLIKEKLLNGIEIVNEHTYSDEALQIALDNNLTLMGTSDIHGLIDWEFGVPKGGHRPITLVFTKERNEASIKEALMQQRTVVFFRNMLIGRNEFLLPLLEQSIRIKEAKYIGRFDVLNVEIENNTSCEFILKNNSSFTLHNSSDIITLKPGETTMVEVKTLKRLPQIEIPVTVLSAVFAPGKHPSITLKATVKE